MVLIVLCFLNQSSDNVRSSSSQQAEAGPFCGSATAEEQAALVTRAVPPDCFRGLLCGSAGELLDLSPGTPGVNVHALSQVLLDPNLALLWH